MILRYICCMAAGLLFALSFFFVMQRMLNFHQPTIKKTAQSHYLEFVKLIREPPPVQRKKRSVPKKPRLKKNKPIPPQLDKMNVNKPRITQVAMPSFQSRIRLNTNDALYLGKFQKSAPLSQAIKMDEEVIPLIRIAPRYPRAATRRGIEGWVKLEVNIGETGTVLDVKVIDARPPRIFNKAAKVAVLKWKFRPKIVNGKAVRRMATQMIKFELGHD